MLLAILTAVVLMYEVRMDQHLQSLIGLADYNYYVFNLDPSGNYGLSWTFESQGGFKRFASVFASPLEHAGATLIALAVIAGVYTRDDYKFKPDLLGWIALGATALSIIFAISRSAFISYCIIVYFYSIVTHKKTLLQLIHFSIAAVIIYFIYYLTQEDRYDELVQDVIIDTLNFTHPSSVGHVLEWVQGITSIYSNPLGIGMGSSGRIGGSLGENIGGENQYIIIGVQAGIIALCLYLSIYVSLVRNARKWYRNLTKKERQLALAILLIKIGFIIPSMTSETESSVYISYVTWFLTGIFISIVSEKKINNGQAVSRGS
jgi:O-antigen ligase